MFGRLLQPEIEQLIDAREFGALKEIFRGWPAPDLAELLGELQAKEEALIISRSPACGLKASFFDKKTGRVPAG